MNQKFKLELHRKSAVQKAQLGDSHVTAMTDNAAFPVISRLPADADFLAALNDLKAANAEVEARRTALKQAQEAQKQKETAFDTALNARANYCQAAKPDDDAALASTALPLRNAPAPVGDLPAPSDLRASMGDQEGEIDLQWDAVYGSSGYKIEFMEHGVPGQAWQPVTTTTRSKHGVTGLTSGKIYAFRVRAMGPKGDGPWSDEAVKMAP